jgi:two-component system, chemotaxis family, CheB/CheR fusion protein
VRILILDDNQDALLVIESFLKTLGHQVSAYTDGREALLWLPDAKPQIIIADLDMPIMDGFDFLKRVRGFQAYVSTPIVCITGTGLSDAQIAAGGFVATLRKPVTLSDLMMTIDELENGITSGGDNAQAREAV